METESVTEPHLSLRPICCELQTLPRMCTAAGWVDSQMEIQWYPQSLCREHKWLYYCGPLTRFTAWVYLFCCHDYQVMYSRSSQQFLLMMVTFRDAIIILHPPLPVCHRPEGSLSSVKCWEKMLRKPLREMAGLRIGFQTPVWDPITLLLEPGMQPDI